MIVIEDLPFRLLRAQYNLWSQSMTFILMLHNTGICYHSSLEKLQPKQMHLEHKNSAHPLQVPIVLAYLLLGGLSKIAILEIIACFGD